MSGMDTHIVVISPKLPSLYVDYVKENKTKSTYFVGSTFKDFNSIAWDETAIDPKTTLVFFYDHQSGIRRMEEAKSRGFSHLVFDDNYPPGKGDNLSGKMLCDPEAWSRLGISNAIPFKDNFGSVNTLLSAQQYSEYVAKFNDITSVYAEFPPVWNGPIRFYPKDSVSAASIEPPLFSKEALADLGLDEDSMAKTSFDEESKKTSRSS